MNRSSSTPNGEGWSEQIPSALSQASDTKTKIANERLLLAQRVEGLLRKVEWGAADDLFGQPNRWMEFHHNGPPEYKVLIADLDRDHYLLLQDVGVGNPKEANPVRIDRVATANVMSSGELQFYDRLSRRTGSSDPVVKTAGDRWSTVYPVWMNELVYGAAVGYSAHVTTVMTKELMHARGETVDTGGFTQVEVDHETLERFRFYNSPQAF